MRLVNEVNQSKQHYLMSDYRYSLAPYTGMNSRYRCPSCGDKDKTFTLYIDNETGEPIHPDVGRCSREVKCGYHYSPKQYLLFNPKQRETEIYTETHFIYPERTIKRHAETL